MKLPALTFLASPWLKIAGIAIAVLAIAGSGFYAGIRWESVARLKLQHSYDERDRKAKDAILAAKADFDAKLAAANEKAAELQAQLNAQRADKDQRLNDTLTKEGSKDAALNACLNRKLPDSILRQLTR